MLTVLKKHYGPGPHKNGTPQSVHGGDDPRTVEPSQPDSRKTANSVHVDRTVDADRKGLGGRLAFRSVTPIESHKAIESRFDRLLRQAENDEARVQIQQQKREALYTEAKKALDLYATGKISLDQFEAYGYGNEALGLGVNYQKWRPLPDTLYHATTSLREVIRDGLKTRRELGGIRTGLGGGTSDMISFTDSRETAEAIVASMREVHDIGTGQLTARDLIAQAEKGGFLQPVMSYWDKSWTPGDPLPSGVQNLIDNKRHVNNPVWFKVDDPKAKEIQARRLSYLDDVASVTPTVRTGSNGVQVVTGWDVTFTREGQARRTMDLYKVFSAFRERKTGQLDPLFWATDPVAVAQHPKENFGVVVAHPQPGARGEQLESLGEWRISTGKAVVVEPQPISKHYGPGPHDNGTPQSVHGGGRYEGGRLQQPPVNTIPGQTQLDVGEANKRISAFEYLARRGELSPEIMEEMKKYPYEAETDYSVEAYNHWQTWSGCRDIRQEAMRQVNDNEATTEAVDPHQDFPSDGFYVPRDPTAYAFYILDQVHTSDPSDQPIYRAVKLQGEEADRFWQVVKEGQDFDAPLLSFATEHKRGSNEFLGPKFGDDVLMVVQPGAKAWWPPEADFAPMYSESDESDFLDQLDETLAFAEAEAKTESEPDLAAYYRDIRQTVHDYRTDPTDDKFEKLADFARDWEIPAKRAGVEVDEEEDPDTYWEIFDNPAENPHEVVSGGRFHVVSVRDDPDGDFGKIVTVQQVGTFDPFTGQLVTKGDVPMLDVESFNQPFSQFFKPNREKSNGLAIG